MLGFVDELLFFCLKCSLARISSLPHILTNPSLYFFFVIFFFYLFIYLLILFLVLIFFCLFSVLFLLIAYCNRGVPIRQFIHASGLLTSIY
jgi:hypothetical protein